jgi:hypothetical protein
VKPKINPGDRIGKACNTSEKKIRNVRKILTRNTEGKILLGRLGDRWENNGS